MPPFLVEQWKIDVVRRFFSEENFKSKTKKSKINCDHSTSSNGAKTIGNAEKEIYGNFASEDIRLKPGYVPPPVKENVTKTKPVQQKKYQVNNDEVFEVPLPGVPVFLPDVSEESWQYSTDSEFGQEVADKLNEPKSDTIVILVETIGRDAVLDFFWKTQKVEENGGILIKNGLRRRTSGGVLFQLLRECKNNNLKSKIAEFFKQISVINEPKNQKPSDVENTEKTDDTIMNN